MNKKDEKLNIICFSNQLWDFDNWTNKHHVMSRLSNQGHKVLFVDPPIRTGRVFLKQIQRGKWDFRRLTTQTKTVNKNLLVYSPLDLTTNEELNSGIHAFKINQLTEKLFKGGKTVLWIYHVEVGGVQTYVEKLKYDTLIYDCVDNYEAFPRYDTPEKKKAVRLQEKYLAEKANVVFATAPGLVDKMKRFNDNVHFTPNVGDYEKFKGALNSKSIPQDIKSIKKPIIGYTGALDSYKFDVDLFKKIVEDHPEYSFVLIGQLALKDKNASLESIGLAQYSNVHFLGSRPYKDIHRYFAGFDAFIIPYQLNDYTVGGCFPVKFHDSLAAALPTVVTDLPAYAPFKDVCYISKTYESFSENLTKAIDENDSKKIKARQKVAQENSWDGKVVTMLKIVRKTLK